jgi:putative transposase
VQQHFGISQRWACKTLDQARSTQRYNSKKPEKDRPLVKRMHDLAREYPRYGYRRIAALLKSEGWPASETCVHRLWRAANLQVPQKKRKRRRLGTSENGSLRLEATHPNHVWSYDFLFDTTESGSTLKLMPILDEYTRECLVIDVSRSITSQDVIERLETLFLERGVPAHIRSDNGPEFVADAIKEHLKALKVETRYIEPGAPWQNAYIESFNGKLRDELLARELFSGVLEAQILAETWRRHYNERRPHSALGYETPAAFAAKHNRSIKEQQALILT